MDVLRIMERLNNQPSIVRRVLVVGQILPLLFVSAVDVAVIRTSQPALAPDANSRLRPGNECGALREGQRLRQIFLSQPHSIVS